ncbi:MAG: hypothetical protein ABWX65_08045 [Mycetocola sp.]
MTDATLPRSRSWREIFIVWGVALVGAILVSVIAPHDLRFTWLAITLATCTLLTFVLQLLTHQKVGFIDRLSISTVGVLAILTLAAAILGLATLFEG